MQQHDGFPLFLEMQWYALDCYVATLTRPQCSSQTGVEQPRLRKHAGRKKPKTDDEDGGDLKNRQTAGDDDDDADDTEDNEADDHSDAKPNT